MADMILKQDFPVAGRQMSNQIITVRCGQCDDRGRTELRRHVVKNKIREASPEEGVFQQRPE